MLKKIFFDHIPKTGGTSFHKVLVMWFGESFVSPQIAGLGFTHAITQYSHIPAIAGHIHYGPGDRLPDDRLSVTIIRDPIDRALSQYFSNKESMRNMDRHKQDLYNLPMEAFFCNDNNAVLSEFSNVYARHFAPLSDSYHKQTGIITTNMLLQFAQESLLKFDIVGLLDDFEDFCAMTAIMAGVTTFTSPPRLRVTQNRLRASDVDAATLDRLRELNSVDIELAEFSKALFYKARTRTLIKSVSAVAETPGDGETVLPARTTSTSSFQPQHALDVEIGSREIEIQRIDVLGMISNESKLLSGEELLVAITLLAHEAAEDLTIGIHINEPSGARVFGTNSRLLGMVLSITTPGQLLVHFKMKCELGRGEYRVGAAVHKGLTHLDKCYHWRESCTSFSVVGAIGTYFEGKTRLYPSISVQGGDDAPASFETTESGITYPRSVMLQSRPLTDFRARLVVNDSNYQPMPGEIFNLPCTISNQSREAWPIAGTRPVCISYHWLNSDGSTVVFDGLRTRLPMEMKGGQTESFPIQIQAPYQAGEYRLQLTIVQEGVAWFEQKGCRPKELAFTVLS